MTDSKTANRFNSRKIISGIVAVLVLAVSVIVVSFWSKNILSDFTHVNIALFYLALSLSYFAGGYIFMFLVNLIYPRKDLIKAKWLRALFIILPIVLLAVLPTAVLGVPFLMKTVAAAFIDFIGAFCLAGVMFYVGVNNL